MTTLTRRQLMQATLAAGFVSPSLAAAPRFAVQGHQFMLDGQPLQIRAGELHYPRIPRGSWRDRLRKLKALGLNTVSAYVFWNAHEAEPGAFDFGDNLDVAAFVRLCAEEGLWVTLRPGPYVCAEWDGGGLPAWLFANGDVSPRTTDPHYLEPVRRWLKRLGQELAPLLIDRGGPILLTQVENEYGAFGRDAAYLQAQAQALRDAGFDGLLYTADPANHLAEGSLPGVVAGINFGANQKADAEFATRERLRPDGPAFCSELWCGWFDAFGALHETTAAQALVDSLGFMQQRGHSFSLYMVHGGTSFGLTAGANWDHKGYQPMVTSYDYDAPLDEAGRPTPKFAAVRALLAEKLPASAFGPMPEPEAAISVPRFELGESAPLTQLLGKPVQAEQPRTLDGLGQNQGLMLYSHRSTKPLRGLLRIGEARDFVLVRANGRLLGTLDRRLGETTIAIDLPAGSTLEIWLDTTGHCHYGRNLGRDQKGLVGPVTLDGKPLGGWTHQSLPLRPGSLQSLRFDAIAHSGPALHRGHFELDKLGYSFLDLRGWGRGYVWVNGHLLGRHWNVGPQRALFVPADWLQRGRNEVVVLELLDSGARQLSGSPRQIWDRGGAAA
jgi:beta-galactosidase